MPVHEALQRLPENSVRARLLGVKDRLARDTDAAVAANSLLSLAISYIVILFISFLLFGILGPDANAICNDPTNYTADECSNATQARGLFWVFLIIVGVAHVLVALAVARNAVK